MQFWFTDTRNTPFKFITKAGIISKTQNINSNKILTNTLHSLITVMEGKIQLIYNSNLQYQSNATKFSRNFKGTNFYELNLFGANLYLCILGSHFLNWLPFSHGNNKTASCNNIKSKHEPPRKNNSRAHITFTNLSHVIMFVLILY